MTTTTTQSQPIEVGISYVSRDSEGEGRVNGWKRNTHRGDRFGTLFSVWFRHGEPVKTDGTGRPHPKLVLAAATAAWRNT